FHLPRSRSAKAAEADAGSLPFDAGARVCRALPGGLSDDARSRRSGAGSCAVRMDRGPVWRRPAAWVSSDRRGPRRCASRAADPSRLSLFASLAAVGAILAATMLAGWVTSLALLPAGSIWKAERWGWSLPLGAAILAAGTAAGLALDVKPGWLCFLTTAAVAGFIARRLRLAGDKAVRLATAQRS